MALLLAGLNVKIPGTTVNRLCGSGLDALSIGVRSIKSGEADLVVAGGVESMSRAPFVIGKSEKAFGRNIEVYDSTIGWRFVNRLMEARYGVDSMPETAENVAMEFDVSRRDQDAFAYRSQMRAHAAMESGVLAEEITEVTIPQRGGEVVVVEKDEHPRPATTVEGLGKLPTPFRRNGGSVTAGNSSGVNDGAGAILLASRAAIERYGLRPRARVLGAAVAGVPPRIMGMGPVPAVGKVLELTGLRLRDVDVFELNEAFAAQAVAVLRQLGLPEDSDHVNPNGGAIAFGHPLGASGTRLAATAVYQLHRIEGRYAVCAMCIGVGQGIAVAIERV
jgi:3-oxoadipyl-CoA thiolase